MRCADWFTDYHLFLPFIVSHQSWQITQSTHQTMLTLLLPLPFPQPGLHMSYFQLDKSIIYSFLITLIYMLAFKNGLNCSAFLNKWSAQSRASTSIHSWRERGKPGGTKRILITQFSVQATLERTLAITRKTGTSPIRSLHLLWLEI